MHGCTAIMRNFLPHARVLARSFLEHHPGGRMTVLVADDAGTIDGEPFDVLGPWDLGLDPEEVHRVLTLFDGPLSAGALRGALIEHLLRTHQEAILFLDADSQVFGPLDHVHELAQRHGVVLSPHLLDPPARHQGYGGDGPLLLAGAFNSGFLAVGPSGAPFVEWWSPRVRRWTVFDPVSGYYGVQRWLDLVPAMFSHHVLRDAGVNVMTMNAHERGLRFRDGRWTTRGGPLRMFHFGGTFDPRTPYLPVAGCALANALFSRNACLADLHQAYGDALAANGWDERPALPMPIELAPGICLDATMRAEYREALLSSERSGSPEPPNPLTHGRAPFLDWLRTPTDLRRNACIVTRYMHARWWREDSLARSFPNLVDEDADRYVAWARSPEGESSGFPALLTRTGHRPVRPVPVAARGVNVVMADRGLAAFLGRRLVEELRATGESVAGIIYPRAPQRRPDVSATAASTAINDVTVICLRAGIVADFDFDVGVLFRPDRHIVLALVDSVWSLDDFGAALQIAHEVWCWDQPTARRLQEAFGAHAEALPFPAAPVPTRGTGSAVVCWADLAESGHAQALLGRVRSYLAAGDPHLPPLQLRVSSWSADPLTAETVWGLARTHRGISVQRADGWRETMSSAKAILSLGEGIGPVEAEALAAGIEVLPHPVETPAGLFGAAAAGRLRTVHRNP